MWKLNDWRWVVGGDGVVAWVWCGGVVCFCVMWGDGDGLPATMITINAKIRQMKNNDHKGDEHADVEMYG